MSAILKSDFYEQMKTQNDCLRKMVNEIKAKISYTDNLLKAYFNGGTTDDASLAPRQVELGLDEYIVLKDDWKKILNKCIDYKLVKYSKELNHYTWAGFGKDKVTSLAHFFMQLRLKKVVQGPFNKTSLGKAVYHFFNLNNDIRRWQDIYSTTIKDTPLLPDKYKDIFEAILK